MSTCVSAIDLTSEKSYFEIIQAQREQINGQRLNKAGTFGEQKQQCQYENSNRIHRISFVFFSKRKRVFATS